MNAVKSDKFFDVSILNNSLICKGEKRITIEEFTNMIHDIIQIADENNIKKLLVDFTKVDYSDLKVIERHKAGEIIAREWGSRKLALVVDEQYINRHVEYTANNRGGNVFVTHNYDEACEWLWK